MEVFNKLDGDIPQANFLKWIGENSEGFFINQRTSDHMILHKASCLYVMSAKPGDITASPLICSVDRRELEDWAAEQSLVPLNLRGECQPWI